MGFSLGTLGWTLNGVKEIQNSTIFSFLRGIICFLQGVLLFKQIKIISFERKEEIARQAWVSNRDFVMFFHLEQIQVSYKFYSYLL